MKITINSIIFCIAVCVFSCKKEIGTLVSTNVDFNVINAQGQDLLNSVFTKDNILVTHLVNGEYVKPSQEIRIYKATLHVLTIYDKGNSEPNITLIQFGNSKPDTIRKELLKTNNSVFCSKVWINGELKFDDSKRTNSIRRLITLVK
jgi:hypothetical protein